MKMSERNFWEKMKSFNLSKIKDPELVNYLALDFTLWLKVYLLIIIMITECVLDIVLISWLFTYIIPIWLSVIFGIIVSVLITFPFRKFHIDWTITYFYYWLAFRKDKIMMSLLEEVKEV